MYVRTYTHGSMYALVTLSPCRIATLQFGSYDTVMVIKCVVIVCAVYAIAD